ncbi:MAG: H/ACA ribonucleoprotein complex subunit GAR1 [Promethearchaeota archaeon]
MNIGSILGIAKSRNIILRSFEGSFAKHLPTIGDKVYTAEKQRVGIIFDIFGPVSKPFVSVKSYSKVTNLFDKYNIQKGSSLFTLGAQAPDRRRSKPAKSKYRAKPIYRGSGKTSYRGKK